jgi:hypothetical protein
MKVGGFLVGEGIDHWGLAQEFMDREKKDKFDMPIEKRIVLFRDSYLELHINPLPVTTDSVNQNALLKDWKG